MVKILLDPSMYHPHMTVAEELRKAADLGYEYIELSPRADFHEWHHYPKVNSALIAEVNKAQKETGVKIWTLNPVFNWAHPNEVIRRHQVRNWKRMLEVADALEVPLIATEFSGDPDQSSVSEGQFYASMEELIPQFEKYGLRLSIEPHPYDFYETNKRGVDIVRGVDRDWCTYQFCFPHAFHLSEGRGDIPAMLDYAGDLLGHIHMADVYNHLANAGNRYIMNPPGVDARIHQHNEIGNGEIDWDEAFAHLRTIGYDAAISVCVFGWEERADEANIRMRERIEKELGA